MNFNELWNSFLNKTINFQILRQNNFFSLILGEVANDFNKITNPDAIKNLKENSILKAILSEDDIKYVIDMLLNQQLGIINKGRKPTLSQEKYSKL